MMRRIRSARRAAIAAGFGLWLAIAVAGAVAVAAEAFVAGIEDLPLMPGLTQLTGSGFAFDSAGGRVVEAYATGDLDPAAVSAFYAETLPQLGWAALGDDRYAREGERLELSFVPGGGPLTLRFNLTPQ